MFCNTAHAFPHKSLTQYVLLLTNYTILERLLYQQLVNESSFGKQKQCCVKLFIALKSNTQACSPKLDAMYTLCVENNILSRSTYGLLKTTLTVYKTTVYLFIIKPLIFCFLITSH